MDSTQATFFSFPVTTGPTASDAPGADKRSRRAFAAGLAFGAIAVYGSLNIIRNRPLTSEGYAQMPASLRPRSDTSSPELDEALRRPDAFAEVEVSDPLAMLDRIRLQLINAGFSSSKVDRASGEILVTRALPKDAKEHIRIWIERDLSEPGKFASVYVRYARTEAVIGSGPRERLATTTMGSDLEALLSKAIN